ncbi:hypothetical protein NRY95_05450 [Xanthomonas campestris pv. phormiicola]|nr:hypothetical protein [Xanthomonas campestris pv. phormiicola]UYC17409.1 hypothetical protein NRY95_05450 [Xanthomonas campestris pv. phormiicola]
MNFGWLRFRWLFNRRVGLALLWTALLLATAFTVNLAGIQLLGNIDTWERWMRDHAVYFLAWRLLLYAGVACGWWWMRKRLQSREPDAESRQRLMRLEICAVIALAVLEGLQLQSA